MIPSLKQIHWDSIMDVLNRKSPSLSQAKVKRIQDALHDLDEEELELEAEYEGASHDEMAALDRELEKLQDQRDILEMALSDPYPNLAVDDENILSWTDDESDDD